MGTHLVLCTRHSIFYRKQHLRDDVYQNGRTERRNGLVHKPALSAMDYQTLLEPVCRHHQDQKMVDPFHADSDVCGIHPADAVHSTAGRGDYGGTTPISMFSITLMLFIITAFASATHDIAADGFYMLALKQSDQAAFVGIRSTFYRLASIFGQGVLVAIAGAIELRTENIPLSWTITMLVTAVLFSLVTFYHLFAVPKPTSDKSTLAADAATAGAIFREFGRTFATYFTKPGALLAIVFMLLYRLPEAFLIKMCMPFLVASKESGGLELSTAEVGIVYGTIGVIFLTLGGILGGLFASRIGLKKSIWWMAGCMTLPCLTFVYLAIAQPDNLFAISTAIAIEQFGYGFGFTAYMLYMMYFSEGEFKTSHYAICTAFMALSMMIPGMFAGYIQEAIGYTDFFWLVMICCFATVVVTIFADRRIDPEYGKK